MMDDSVSGALVPARKEDANEDANGDASSDMPAASPLLIPGSTCWKAAVARQLSVIQDAGPAFLAMASALEAARRTIFILGWDLDSRTVLRPEGAAPADRTLLPLLCRCLERQPALEIFVLIWDFSFIYAFEREPRPRSQFGRVHPRLHFALDSNHGSGGSHHQKVVVIDDDMAFVGGIDLTLHRWDTPEHAPVDTRRRDGSGALYGPFHDVHAAVSGPAAVALGQLARSRWGADGDRPRAPDVELATSRVPSTTSASSPGRRGSVMPPMWPGELAVDATDIEVALARTWVVPGHAPIREVEAITLRALAAAQRWIYVENQYLTSGAVVRALGQSLSSATGPEVLVILPEAESGWMEQSSMGILRDEALAILRAKDQHDRLRLLAPVVCQSGETTRVAVHAKVLVIDDRLAKVGSANLSNRSMGLDSECDLVVECRDGDAASARFIASVRNRLLGEHLGLPAAEIADRLAAHGSLRRIVDPISEGARRLVPVPIKGHAPFDFTVLDGAMVDPPEPWNTELLLQRAVPIPFRRRLAMRWRRPAVLAAGAIALVLLIRQQGPHMSQVHAAILHAADWLAGHPAGAFAAIFAYAAAGVIFVPVTLLATSTLAVFGMWPGVAIAWSGGLLSAMVSHAVGGRLGQRALAWLPDRFGARLRHFLVRRAFWGTVLIRFMPVGNFGALNLVAGAVKIPRRSFLLGNMVGLFPGLLGLGVVVDRVLTLYRRPSVPNVIAVCALIGLLSVLGYLVKRRFGRTPAVAAGDDVRPASGTGS